MMTHRTQTCITPDYIITTPERVDAVVEQLKKTIVDFYTDNPGASLPMLIISSAPPSFLRRLLAHDQRAPHQARRRVGPALNAAHAHRPAACWTTL